MRYRYLDDFRRGISVFAIFSYGIAVLGTPQCPPPDVTTRTKSNITMQGPVSCPGNLTDPKSNQRLNKKS